MIYAAAFLLASLALGSPPALRKGRSGSPSVGVPHSLRNYSGFLADVNAFRREFSGLYALVEGSENCYQIRDLKWKVSGVNLPRDSLPCN